ncbi:MAG: acyl-ACP--UDP-N-acetylglucosamine O-acyltransferase [Chthoniobacterales bacterium]
MKIHPTAVIDGDARLGESVEVGPYSIIAPDVVIGDGSIVQSHVVLEGSVTIGTNNRIGHGSIVGGLPQDLSFKEGTQSGVTIGDNNVLREHCTINRGTAADTATVLGHDNYLMAGVHLGHNCRVGDNVIIANDCLLGGYVQIDDRSFIGGGTGLHQHLQVGRLVMTQGHASLSKDVPPFLIVADLNLAVGLNVVGMRRAGMTAAERDDVKRAFKLLYRSGLNIAQALEQAATSNLGVNGREFFDFVAKARKRGIVAHRGADD